MPSLRGGGVERQLLTLSEELTRHGFDLDLVVVNTKNSAYSPSSSLRLIDLGAGQIRLAFPRLIRYLRTAKPQVMFSAETPVNALAILCRLAARHPGRLLIGERNHMSSVAKNSTRLADRMRPQIVRHLYPYSSMVIAVSRGVAGDLIHSCKIRPEKISVIYNMFNIEKIMSDARAEPDHPWLRQPQQPVIISVGRLSVQKDHQNLIRAFAILRARRACRLIILGEGTERSRLESLARELGIMDDVSMPGFVLNPFSYMARSNVFVLSSAWEGLPGALIEALACGVPVVSTDCPSGPSEILENGKYGVLTPVGDEQKLAQAISLTLDHPHPASLVQQRAMDFSIENIMPKYIDIFQSSGA